MRRRLWCTFGALTRRRRGYLLRLASRFAAFAVLLIASERRAGHFNALHDHAGASVSGVLWVRAPPAPRGVEFSGCLFLALRFPSDDAPGAYALVAPAEGGLIAFPGHLAHAVLPLAPEALRDPDDVRISLAFNYP